MTYTMEEMRRIALGAVRSYLRQMKIDPLTATADDAEKALDDICRTEDSLIVHTWWVQCNSGNQTRLFCREWREWQRTEREKENA